VPSASPSFRSLGRTLGASADTGVSTLDLASHHRPGPLEDTTDGDRLPPIAMLAGPSRRSPTPARRTVAHTTNSRLSNVRPGRHIDRYRIAHSGRQAIILVGRKKVCAPTPTAEVGLVLELERPDHILC
jgi:hypothetical protein